MKLFEEWSWGLRNRMWWSYISMIPGRFAPWELPSRPELVRRAMIGALGEETITDELRRQT